jgi:hypothetical protein
MILYVYGLERLKNAPQVDVNEFNSVFKSGKEVKRQHRRSGKESSSSAVSSKAANMAEGLRLATIAFKNLRESASGAFIICIDGDVSTGKTTLAALLRREISSTEKASFLGIGIDGIIAGLIEEGLSPLFAFLEVPFVLSERIRPEGKAIYIIEGTRSVDYVSQAGLKPDIAVFVNTGRVRQLFRITKKARYPPAQDMLSKYITRPACLKICCLVHLL